MCCNWLQLFLIQLAQEYINRVLARHKARKSVGRSDMAAQEDTKRRSFLAFRRAIELQSKHVQTLEYAWSYPCMRAIACIHMKALSLERLYSLDLLIIEVAR